MKFLSVIRNNPELRIFVALQRPNQRLNKQSKTTLAQWCQARHQLEPDTDSRLTSSTNGSTGNKPPSMSQLRKLRRRDDLPRRLPLLLQLPRTI